MLRRNICFRNFVLRTMKMELFGTIGCNTSLIVFCFLSLSSMQIDCLNLICLMGWDCNSSAIFNRDRQGQSLQIMIHLMSIIYSEVEFKAFPMRTPTQQHYSNEVSKCPFNDSLDFSIYLQEIKLEGYVFLIVHCYIIHDDLLHHDPL